jgi:hypothetical protein
MQQYQPFHLKYRPQTLSEVIGQKHVTQTLTNAIQTKKIAAAYLFTGGKGTGKTSTARRKRKVPQLPVVKLSNHISAWDYSVQVWFLKYLQYKWWGQFRSVGQLDKFTQARKRLSSNVNPKNIWDALLLP